MVVSAYDERGRIVTRKGHRMIETSGATAAGLPEPADRVTPWLSALAFFFVLTSYYIVRPVRDQLSGAVGSTQLPWFYAATFVAMLVLTPLFGLLVARFRRAPLLGWSYSFFIACLLAFVPAFHAQDQIGARTLGIVFFVWASVFNLFVVSLFWSFMADIYSSAQARSLFPMIALAGMAGALFGPTITSVLVVYLGVAPLLIVSAAMLALALWCLLALSVRNKRLHPVTSAPDEVIGGSLWAGVRAAWAQPFLRYMALLMLLSDGIGTLAYALVADYAKATFPGNAQRTEFYAHMDLAINLFGAVMQVTVTRWLLVRFGAVWGLVVPSVVNVLLLLFVALFGQASFHFFLPGFSFADGFHAVPVTLAVVALMQIVTRGTTYGMIKPATDSLYTRVPREIRYKGKNFVETTVWRFGDLVVTSGVVGLRALGVGVAGMALLCAGLSVVATYISGKAGTAPDLLPETRQR
jgi:AAA family ATP:ADP antiporter